MDVYRVRHGGTWRYNDIPADTGVVFELQGCVNDEKLIRLGFIEKMPSGVKLASLPRCSLCGLRFDTDRARNVHGDRRHTDRGELIEAGALPPMAGAGYSDSGLPVDGVMVQDLTGDREERQMEREAPLYLDQTIASRR